MSPESFCYWLQGFAELSDAAPTPEQWKSIREHLALVFAKVTPPVTHMHEMQDAIKRAAHGLSHPTLIC